MKIYEYSVIDKNSMVLGYGATSVVGARLWQELDWSYAFKDSSFPDCEYLHVRCKHDPEQDYPIGQFDPEKHSRQYRVRCSLYPGRKWRRGVVDSVEVVRRGDRWTWVVGVNR